MSLRCALLLAVLALTGCAQIGLGNEKCSLDGRCARPSSTYVAVPANGQVAAAAEAPVR